MRKEKADTKKRAGNLEAARTGLQIRAEKRMAAR
jgi:hypothetical protein